MSVDIQEARAFLRARERRRQEVLDQRFAEAWRDVRRIVERLVAVWAPARIWQWGSLLRRREFCEFSDIDLAVEGIGSAARFFALCGDASGLTRFPLDLLEIEHIEPEFAELIRLKGAVVYDRDDPDPGPHFRA